MPANDDSDALEKSVAAKQRAQQAFIARRLASLEAAKKVANMFRPMKS